MGKVYYNQLDSRWKNHPYPASGGYQNKTVGSSGCGPTCAAMIVSSWKETVTPDKMCDISRENGFRVPGGTSDNLFPYVAQRWGLEYKRVSSSFEAHQACKEGWFVVICCGPGLWTDGGHFILAVGANDTDIEIYDPYLYSGKYNINGRAGKVNLIGNSAWVEINTFKANANAQRFFAFRASGNNQPQPTPSYQPTIKYVNTSSANLNVRNAKNGTVIGSLRKGTEVTVYEDSDGWSKIGEGKWVSSQYLATTKPSQPAQTSTVMKVKTNGANLNVRQQPSTSAKVVGSLANGTTVTVLSQSNGWAQIDKGYVSASYLVSTTTNTPAPTSRGTVGQTKVLKQASKIYKNSNKSGTVYDYKANTTVIIQQNTTATLDKVKVKQTGRIGYIDISMYK